MTTKTPFNRRELAAKRRKARVRPNPAKPDELPAPALASGRPLESLALDVIARAARPVGRTELAKVLHRRRAAVDDALEVLWRRGRITWTTTGDAQWVAPTREIRKAAAIS